MTTEALTTMLELRGVSLYLEGEAIRFRAPKGALTAELKDQIAEHRTAVIAQLRSPTSTDAGSRIDDCRCETKFWIDESPQEGRIRTHCGECGRFIGYRPKNLVTHGNKALEPGAPRIENVPDGEQNPLRFRRSI